MRPLDTTGTAPLLAGPNEPVALLIEDSVADVELIRAALGRIPAEPVRLVQAHTMAEARRLTDVEPDAIVLDLFLPDSEGTESLKAVSVMWPGVPVIVISGVWPHEEATRIIYEGAYDFVPKDPVWLAILPEKIRQAIARHRGPTAEEQRERAAEDLARAAHPLGPAFGDCLAKIDRIEQQVQTATHSLGLLGEGRFGTLGSGQGRALEAVAGNLRHAEDLLGSLKGDARRAAAAQQSEDAVARLSHTALMEITDDEPRDAPKGAGAAGRARPVRSRLRKGRSSSAVDDASAGSK